LKDFKKDCPKADVKKIWFGDQSNSTFLQSVIVDYQHDEIKFFKSWDIIVDDGGHRFEQIKQSFLSLWPHISRGGVCVIDSIIYTAVLL
jgi:hypothetical protein